MSYSISIKDNLTPHLAAFREGMQPENLHPRIGATAVQVFQRNFRALDQSNRNKIGGTPTHFYADAARQTSFRTVPDGVFVSCTKLGVLQRWKGGQIKAGKSSAWLTIPNTAESYGHRARDFDNLRFVLFNPGLAALITGKSGATRTTQTTGGPRVKGVAGTESKVLYWLKKSVTQVGNENVVPSQDDLRSAITTMLRSYTARLARRTGQTGSQV